MKLYISAATLRTIANFGHADLTHITSSPTDHMCVQLEIARAALQAAPATSAEPIYQQQYYGEGVWRDMPKDRWDACKNGVLAVDQRFRIVFAAPQPAADAPGMAEPVALDMSLEARLADAEADVARLHKEKMDLWMQVHGYAAPQPVAQTERELTDARDAARYRWLREQVTRDPRDGYYDLPQVFAWDIKPGPQLNEEFPNFDAAVDAVMAAAQPASGETE